MEGTQSEIEFTRDTTVTAVCSRNLVIPDYNYMYIERQKQADYCNDRFLTTYITCSSLQCCSDDTRECLEPQLVSDVTLRTSHCVMEDKTRIATGTRQIPVKQCRLLALIPLLLLFQSTNFFR